MLSFKKGKMKDVKEEIWKGREEGKKRGGLEGQNIQHENTNLSVTRLSGTKIKGSKVLLRSY